MCACCTRPHEFHIPSGIQARIILLSPAIHWAGWVELGKNIIEPNFCGKRRSSERTRFLETFLLFVCLFVCLYDGCASCALVSFVCLLVCLYDGCACCALVTEAAMKLQSKVCLFVPLFVSLTLLLTKSDIPQRFVVSAVDSMHHHAFASASDMYMTTAFEHLKPALCSSIAAMTLCKCKHQLHVQAGSFRDYETSHWKDQERRVRNGSANKRHEKLFEFAQENLRRLSSGNPQNKGQLNYRRKICRVPSE